MVGLRSDAVDYAKWPELTAEKLEAGFKDVVTDLTREGYRAVWCLTDQGKTAAAQVEEALIKEHPDVVVVGAGVRIDPDLLLLFEMLINLIHEHAPQAKIVFNHMIHDTVDAVRRWS